MSPSSPRGRRWGARSGRSGRGPRRWPAPRGCRPRSAGCGSRGRASRSASPCSPLRPEHLQGACATSYAMRLAKTCAARAWRGRTRRPGVAPASWPACRRARRAVGPWVSTRSNMAYSVSWMFLWREIGPPPCVRLRAWCSASSNAGAGHPHRHVRDHRAGEAQQLVAERQVERAGRGQHVALGEEHLVEEDLALGVVAHAHHVGGRAATDARGIEVDDREQAVREVSFPPGLRVNRGVGGDRPRADPRRLLAAQDPSAVRRVCDELRPSVGGSLGVAHPDEVAAVMGSVIAQHPWNAPVSSSTHGFIRSVLSSSQPKFEMEITGNMSTRKAVARPRLPQPSFLEDHRLGQRREPLGRTARLGRQEEAVVAQLLQRGHRGEERRAGAIRSAGVIRSSAHAAGLITSTATRWACSRRRCSSSPSPPMSRKEPSPRCPMKRR